LLVATFERGEAFGDGGEVGEIVGAEDFAPDDREVDLFAP